MSLLAPIEDGKLVSSTAEAESKTNKSTGNSMDKEAFLQLLVAQMKYQDPLEPTSNTEYISQYAQFSQVESMQNMSSSMDLQRASALVGKEVYVQTTTSSGETKYVFGKVDYVTYEGGKAYLYINEQRYSLDELETIVDPVYEKAYNMATELVNGINKLPHVEGLALSDKDTVMSLKKTYDDMDEYQKSFVAQEKVISLQQYVAKIEELEKKAEAGGNGGEENGDA